MADPAASSVSEDTVNGWRGELQLVRAAAKRTGAWGDSTVRRRWGLLDATTSTIAEGLRPGIEPPAVEVLERASATLSRRMRALGEAVLGHASWTTTELIGLDGAGSLANDQILARPPADGGPRPGDRQARRRANAVPPDRTQPMTSEVARAAAVLEARSAGARLAAAEGAGASVDREEWAALGAAGAFATADLTGQLAVLELLSASLVAGPLTAQVLWSGLVEGASSATVVLGMVVQRPFGSVVPPMLCYPDDVDGIVLLPPTRDPISPARYLTRRELEVGAPLTSVDPLTPLSLLGAVPEAGGLELPLRADELRQRCCLALAAQQLGVAARACAWALEEIAPVEQPRLEQRIGEVAFARLALGAAARLVADPPGTPAEGRSGAQATWRAVATAKLLADRVSRRSTGTQTGMARLRGRAHLTASTLLDPAEAAELVAAMP